MPSAGTAAQRSRSGNCVPTFRISLGILAKAPHADNATLRQYNRRMKLSELTSPWALILGVACVAVAAANFAPAGFEVAQPISGAGLAVVVFVWYLQRMLGRGGDEYAKLQMAAFAVQVLGSRFSTTSWRAC